MPKKHYEKWTKDDIDVVFSLRSRGETYAKIAKLMGRSTSAVTNAVYREIKRNIAEADSMTVQPPEFRQNITREELMKELLPGLNKLFGSEYEKYRKDFSEIMKPPTLFDRIKRKLGVSR